MESVEQAYNVVARLRVQRQKCGTDRDNVSKIDLLHNDVEATRWDHEMGQVVDLRVHVSAVSLFCMTSAHVKCS